MLSKRRAWETEDSINQLFERSTAGIEIETQLRDLQKRHFETSFSNNFTSSLMFGDKKTPEAAAPETAAKKTPIFVTNKATRASLTGGSLTERLHRGTQASIRLGRRQGQASSYAGVEPYPRGAAELGKRTFYHA